VAARTMDFDHLGFHRGERDKTRRADDSVIRDHES
jgi:hypothetical protein